MDNLIFALNVTLPFFIMIAFGYFLKRIKLLNEPFLKVADKFNFKVTLPVKLFVDLSTKSFQDSFDLKLLLFCAITTSVIFWGTWAAAGLVIKDKSKRGEFVQASYRSSVALVGSALFNLIYAGAVSLQGGLYGMMVLGCVPLYNIYAVVVLQATSPEGTKGNLKKTILGIVKNPIILGIVLGLISSLLRIDYPPVIDTSLEYVSRIATPLALICLGAEFNFSSAKSVLKYSISASLLKIVVLPALFVTIAILMGFRNESLVSIFVMLAGSTTPSAYIMAKQYGHEGSITASTVVLTTLGSIGTLTLFVFLLRNFSFI